MISFVYFDLGGTVIEDFYVGDRWRQLMDELGVKPEDRAAFAVLWEAYEPQLCVDLDPQAMLPVLKARFGITVPENYSLLNDGFVKRFRSNPSIWPVIREIKSKVRVGLLTNMYPGMFAAIQNASIMPPDIEWDIIIDSTAVGYAKPDSQMYQIAQARAGLPGDQIFFTDNKRQNVEAAQAFDWRTFWYNPAEPEASSRKLLEFFHKNYTKQ